MNKSYNIVVGLLKSLACIAVVIIHFGNNFSATTLAVPIFVISAIFYSARIIQNGAFDELKQRLVRILLPLWVWSSVALILEFMHGGRWEIWQILAQYSLGHTVSCALYFLPVLAMLTSFLWAICRISRNKFVASLVLCFVVAMVIQYAGLNFEIASRLPDELKFPIGRMLEMLPIAIVGLLVYQFRDCRYLMPILFLFLGGAILIRRLGFVAPGLGYSGLQLTFLSSVVFVMCEKLGNRLSARLPVPPPKALRAVFAATPGVYFVHLIVGAELTRFLQLTRGVLCTILVLLFSFILTLLLRRVPWLSAAVK